MAEQSDTGEKSPLLSENLSALVEPELVASFFISSDSLFLHFGPDGPVLVLMKDSISELHLKTSCASNFKSRDTVIVAFAGTFVITKNSIGDIKQLWSWFQDLD